MRVGGPGCGFLSNPRPPLGHRAHERFAKTLDIDIRWKACALTDIRHMPFADYVVLRVALFPRSPTSSSAP
jgi:hypothetical protein